MQKIKILYPMLRIEPWLLCTPSRSLHITSITLRACH